MKKMKKILAFVMTMAMFLGMRVASLAANGDGNRDSTDTAVVTIKGLEKVVETSEDADNHPTVTLYKVAKGNYNESGIGLKENEDPYVGMTGIDVGLNEELNRYEVNLNSTVDDEIANDIALIGKKAVEGTVGESIIPTAQSFEAENDGTFTYKATVNAGAYVAVITGGVDTIYNPVLLTASYDESGELKAGNVDLTTADNTYLYGATTVVKKTEVDIKKTAEVDESKEDTRGDKTILTVSVGDEVSYTIEPTIPSYPENATNKTAYVRDIMSKGLTFDYDSLTVTLGNNEIEGVIDQSTGKKTFTLNDKIIAIAYKYEVADTTDTNVKLDAFRLAFNYDNVVEVTKGIESTTKLIVTYKAVINDDAVVGANTNEAKLIYNNDPKDDGKSYDDPGQDDPTNPNYKDVTEEKDETNTVYTYRLGFQKADENGDGLAGAKFGIYAVDSEETANNAVSSKSVGSAALVEIVTTEKVGNDAYAVSGQLSKGWYLIKEISAPGGYSVNDAVYKVEVKNGSATTTATVTKRVYTATKPGDDAKQIGWLKGGETGIFYPNDKYTKETAPEGVVPAYLGSETKNVTIEQSGNGGTTMLDGGPIKNTRLNSLPSTGGIGTTVFTIGGCAIMIVAAGLFFASRRKSAR